MFSSAQNFFINFKFRPLQTRLGVFFFFKNMQILFMSVFPAGHTASSVLCVNILVESRTQTSLCDDDAAELDWSSCAAGAGNQRFTCRSSSATDGDVMDLFLFNGFSFDLFDLI